MKNIYSFVMVAVALFTGTTFVQAEESGNVSARLDRILGPAAATPVVLESTSVIRDAQGKRALSANGKAPVIMELSRFKVADGVRDISLSPVGNIIVKSTASLAIYGPDGRKLKTLEGGPIYSSDNNKYFAIPQHSEKSKNTRWTRLTYVRLYDENGNLLWEREGVNLSLIRLSSKGHVALLPRIEDSGSANIFDASGATITPAGVFKNENSYEVTFSDSGDSYLLNEVYRERQASGKSLWHTTLHVFSAGGSALFAKQIPADKTSLLIRTKPIIGAEAFIFSINDSMESVSSYDYADIEKKEFRPMNGLDGYVLKYAKYLGNNRVAIFTMDSFIVWDLSKNIPLSVYLLNGNSDKRAHDNTAVMVESVVYVNNRFIAIAMGPHRQDYEEGNGFVFVFDSAGRKIQEKSFPIGTFMVFTRVFSVGDRLFFSAGQDTFHSLRVE